jgi:hypothetical protein
MQRESKKHHYVPRSLLRYFSVNGVGRHIHVFDKVSGKSYPSSLDNAGSENDYNKLHTDNGILNVEPEFDEPDGRLAELLRQMHGSRNVSALTARDRRDWADMAAVQILRTPITRTTLSSITADFVGVLAECGLPHTDEMRLPSENDAKRSTFEMLGDRDAWRLALEDKDFVLFEPSGAARFWLSDNPVVRQSMVPYGDGGLSSPGVAVYLPLGPDLALGMICKSAARSLNARPIEALAIEPARAQGYIALREGLRTGRPVARSDEFVDGFNNLQAACCSRFIYRPDDSFDAVREMLREHPDLAHVKSNQRMGRLGQALPPAPGMPDGLWLVLFGRLNHHMLQIREREEEREPIEIVTGDIEMLARAASDAPFNEMRLYQDRQVRRMKRDVRIEIMPLARAARLRIRSSDPAMDALDAMIAERRR